MNMLVSFWRGEIVVIVVEVVVKAMVEVEVQLLFRVGGWIKRN